MLPLQAPSRISARTAASCSSHVPPVCFPHRPCNHNRSCRGHTTAPLTQLQPVASPSLQQHFPDQHRHPTRTNASTMDVMPAWTPDQIVGMIFFVSVAAALIWPAQPLNATVPTYIHALLCGNRSLAAMDSRAVAGGLTQLCLCSSSSRGRHVRGTHGRASCSPLCSHCYFDKAPTSHLSCCLHNQGTSTSAHQYLRQLCNLWIRLNFCNSRHSVHLAGTPSQLSA
jgi:hypothetical protein